MKSKDFVKQIFEILLLFGFSFSSLFGQEPKQGIIDAYVSSEVCGIFAQKKLVQEPIKVVKYGEKILMDAADRELIEHPGKNQDKWIDGKPWIRLKDSKYPTGWILRSCLQFGDEGKNLINKWNIEIKQDPCTKYAKLSGIWKNGAEKFIFCLNGNELGLSGKDESDSFSIQSASGKDPIIISTFDTDATDTIRKFNIRILNDQKISISYTHPKQGSRIKAYPSSFKNQKEMEFERVPEETVAPEGLRGIWTRKKLISPKNDSGPYYLNLCKAPFEMREIVAYNLEQTRTFPNFYLESDPNKVYQSLYFMRMKVGEMKVHRFAYKTGSDKLLEGDRDDDLAFKKCE